MGISSLLPPVVVTLLAETNEFTTKMGAARGELDLMQSKGESSMSSFGTFGAAAFMAVGAAAIGLGVEALHLADTFEVSHARLTASLTANGTSFDAWSTQIGAADKAAEKLGFTNAQTEDALGRLETMVKNPTVALKDLSVAEDVARARGMDLTTAANMVGKASEGTYTALVRLGVVTAAQAKQFKSGADAVDYLSKAFAGQASGYADTFAGKLQVLTATSEDLGKNLGLWLIPKIEAVASGLSTGIHFIEDHRVAQIALAGAITALTLPALAGLVTALGGALFAAATTVWTVMADLVMSSGAVAGAFVEEGAAAATAGAEFNASLGPIGLVAAAFAGLVVLMGQSSDAAKRAGDTWANDFVSNVSTASNESALLKDQIAKLTTTTDDMKSHMGFWADAAYRQFGNLPPAIAKNVEETKVLQKALADLNTAQQVANITNGESLLTTDQLKEATAAATIVDQNNASQKSLLALAVSNASQAVKDATTATNDYYSAALTADGADIAWTLNLDALRTSVAKTGHSLDTSTVAGANNKAMVDKLVGATQTLIEKELGSGDTAEGQKGKIQGYVDKLDAAFTSAGFTAGQIAALNTQYGLTPKSITTEINANVGPAEAQLALLAKQAQMLSTATINSAGIIGGSYSMPAGKPMAVVNGALVPRAAGGDALAGQPYLIGEKGPELFMPDLGGTVVSNDRILAALAGSSGNYMVDAALTQIDNATNTAISSLTARTAAASAVAAQAGHSGGANAQLMQQMAAARGWTGAQWNALYDVEMREAGFNQFAQNPSSSAYGIAQALPPTKYPFAGQRAGGSDPATQIAWMLSYVADRYGTPTGALAHEQQVGWYDNGGLLMPGMTMAWNGTGSPERVTPGTGGGGGEPLILQIDGQTIARILIPLLAPGVRQALMNRGRAQTSIGLG